MQYFTRLPYLQDENWRFHNVAIIKVYSAPDKDLLILLSQTVAACALTNQLAIVDVKSITSVVAMIPRRMVLPNGEKVECFCQLSQPGLDASVLAIAYDIFTDPNDDQDKVEY